jgi:hypothetical protein
MDLGVGRGLQVSYTLARTEQEFPDGWHPSSWDATHVLAVIGAARLFRDWALIGAWQLRSGLAATPLDSRVFYSLPFGGGVVPRIVYGPTNSGRLPGFNRADVGVRRSWGVERQWTFSAQLINVLYTKNVVSYRPGDYLDALVHGVDPLAADECRAFLPTIGLQVRWCGRFNGGGGGGVP